MAKSNVRLTGPLAMVIVAAIGFVGGLVPAWLDDTKERLEAAIANVTQQRDATQYELKATRSQLELRDQARQECVDEITDRLSH